MSTQPLTDERLRLAYHFPGRLRVRADRLRESPEVVQAVAARLDGEPGVESHVFNPVTGSLLVIYDAHAVQLASLIRSIVEAGGFAGLRVDFSSADLPADPPGVRIRAALDGFNTRIRTLTRGEIDLRTAGPGALAALGVGVFALGRRTLPQWYDLLFWSFVTFVNLNPPRTQVDASQT